MIPLEQRARTLNRKPAAQGSCVVYWMSRDQRAEDNWALLYAQQEAQKRQLPLRVLFCLDDRYPSSRPDHIHFMRSGLKRCARDLEAKNIPFHLLLGTPQERIPLFLAEADPAMLVSDFSPLQISRQWKQDLESMLPVQHMEVDTRNVVPCFVASNKREYGAYTLRPKIHRLLETHLTDFPPVALQPLPPPLTMGLDEVRSVLHPHPDTPAPKHRLKSFLEEGLLRYHLRNDPNAEATSQLSAHLHFGQISSQRIALEVLRSHQPDHGLLEELIVRRELADNFCYYEPNYRKISAFPAWALETLAKHEADEREYLYDLVDFEEARTHDPLWNAAQNQMVYTGYMHGYMRMYWAKKILEWTPDPQTAMDVAIDLNDRFNLDGRDPNGYAGIAWSMGGVHDRAWQERPVFGKIRYMNYNGCKRKFDVEKYIKKYL
jgi:deoxyribodipyrimidine photo-lyase